MFKKKKEKRANKQLDNIDSNESTSEEPSLSELEESIETPLDIKPDFWDVISPEGIKINKICDDHGIMKQSLGTKTYFRPFYIPRDGYPRKLMTNWISTLTSTGETDLMIDIHKLSKSGAMRMLQKQNTIIKANLDFQLKRGNQDSVIDNRTKIEDTEILMEESQFNENDSYLVSVKGVMYADSERELDKYSEFIEDSMSSKHMKIVSTWGRVKKGLRSVTPFSNNEIKDSVRNIDRRALSTFSTFISGNGRFNGGIPIGINKITGQKEFFNAFGTQNYRPDNYNMAIFGISGSGKSLGMKLLLARETTGLGVYSRIIDIEGEFVSIVKRLGGVNITLSEESDIVLNPLAMNVTTIPYEEDDEELELLEDEDAREYFEKDGKKYISFVPLRQKINETIDFFDIICRGKNQEDDGINVFERNFVEEAMKYLFGPDRFNYTTHPSSLYEKGIQDIDGKIIQSMVRKPEPTISDVYNYLLDHYKNEYNAERLLAAIRPFLRDGSKPIFDGQTYLGKNTDSIDIHTARLINFNLKHLDEGFLRPIAYHVVLNYTWEYFMKNVDNEMLKKIVYADEFWKFVDNEQTVSFGENIARRARKRNGGFRIASQDFVRILESKKARGILQNTHSYFFLKQNKIDLAEIQKNFDLSKGELNILFQNPDKGEGILRIGRSSVHLQTDPSAEEIEFIESNAAVLAESKKRRQFMSRSS
ncbi:DUF87 domain-containing protein [Psychrobacillus sp. FSL K6-2684]|uniref:VirB4 family type IV secretion system protein n=1 Tax=unclassified Psychrobacillus TaxID=2636677 RepID=UPI0030F85792